MFVCKNNASETSRRAPIRQGCDNAVRATQDSKLNHIERDIIMRVENSLNRRYNDITAINVNDRKPR